MFIQSINAYFLLGTWLDTGDKMTSKTDKGPVLKEPVIMKKETDGNHISPQNMELTYVFIIICHLCNIEPQASKTHFLNFFLQYLFERASKREENNFLCMFMSSDIWCSLISLRF